MDLYTITFRRVLGTEEQKNKRKQENIYKVIDILNGCFKDDTFIEPNEEVIKSALKILKKS